MYKYLICCTYSKFSIFNDIMPNIIKNYVFYNDCYNLKKLC